jgi:MOSC domain-containing protein
VTPVTVCGLAITPVKGTRLRAVESVRLDRHGARENRRFFLIDEDDQMVNATHLGALNTVVSTYSDRDRRLSLAFPNGREVEDDVRLGDEVVAGFYKQPTPARLVLGEFSEAISEHVGKQLQLVEAGEEGAVDRGPTGAVTLISTASLARLADQAGRPSIDSRRFRMLIEVDGVGAHEEDDWVGHDLRVGEVLLHAQGHVGRCVITSRHPDSGEIDLHTLKVLGSYRRHLATTEPVSFGIYGEIIQPGEIRVGETVTLGDD